MKKTLTTAILIGTTVSSILFSTAPAFAANPDPSKFPSNCQTLSPGVTECNDVLDHLTNGYPAPVVTPNTVNGTAPASVQPTPAPVAVVPESNKLAETGVDGLMVVWGGVGTLALAAGIASVIHVRRKAKA